MNLPEYEEAFGWASGLSDHHDAVDEFLPALLDGLASTPPEAAALEIGVYRGGSAVFTLWHVLHEGKGRRFITVDHGGEADDQGLRDAATLWGAAQQWTHYEADQHDWIYQVLPTLGLTFGFIYHDGEHGDGSVGRDVAGLMPYLVSGGILAIDDAHECSVELRDITLPAFGLVRVTEYSRPREGCGECAFYRKTTLQELAT